MPSCLASRQRKSMESPESRKLSQLRRQEERTVAYPDISPFRPNDVHASPILSVGTPEVVQKHGRTDWKITREFNTGLPYSRIRLLGYLGSLSGSVI
ncbi:hypothetical protein IG631_06144 [Alternaria alternata]|nr:hypothetical protein IG631_06144 [Alternaria alternata]